MDVTSDARALGAGTRRAKKKYCASMMTRVQQVLSFVNFSHAVEVPKALVKPISIEQIVVRV